MLTDPNPCEIAAMNTAGERAGEYLESLGKSDLAAMSDEEWRTLIAVTCGGYVESLLQQRADAIAGAERIAA